MKNIFLSILLSLMYTSLFSQVSVKVGVVSDFSFEKSEGQMFYKKLSQEVTKVLGSSKVVLFNKEDILISNFNQQLSNENYNLLTQSCNLILAIGPTSVRGALNSTNRAVPTIAIGVVNTDLQEIPYTEKGTSGVENFTYILTSDDFRNELNRFYDLVKYKSVSVLFDSRFMNTINKKGISNKIQDLKKALDSEINFVALDLENVSGTLESLPNSTDAVFVAIPYTDDMNYISEISDYLIKKKLPSYSVNMFHVDKGILACASSDNGIEIIIRKIAIMIDDVLSGGKLSEVLVDLDLKKDLYLNLATAKKIGFSPSFDLLFSSNLVKEFNDIHEVKYSIEEIIERAIKTNLDIKLSQKDFQLSNEDVKSSYSNILPTLNLSATGVQINSERANAQFKQPEKTFTGTLEFQQLLYSDKAIAGIKIQKYIQKAQEYATKQDINNVILDCYVAYFNVLQAKTNVIIQKENFDVSKKNLELSKVRVNLGSTNKADVFRWESEQARSTQSLIEARAAVAIAQFKLNTLLDNTLGDEFNIVDAKLDEGAFVNYFDMLPTNYFKTPQQLELITKFLIGEAKVYHPLEKQLEYNLLALNRQDISNRRSYYLPTIAIQSKADNVLWRGGIASEPMVGQSYTDLSWNVGLSVSIPIFDGNRRRRNYQKTKINREKIVMQKQNLTNNLELNIKAKTIDIVTAHTNLKYSKISSHSADENYKLVQENYKQGVVTVTQLIDAQKAALQAKQSYYFSVYNYMISYAKIEHAVGSFSLVSDRSQNEAIREKFKQFILKFK